MRKIDFAEVEKIWDNNRDPVMLYIHSPYCRQICTYCVYRGVLKDANFDKCFRFYLPSQVDKYREIIGRQDVQVMYFGGGTPNFDGLSHMIPVFEKTKDIPCREKVIELHTGIPVTDDDLELLLKYGFTTVILCQQTFNGKILREFNRYIMDGSDVDVLIGKLHGMGISVGMDLIQFCGLYGDEVKRDLERVMSFANLPDEITVAPLYQLKDMRGFRQWQEAREVVCDRYSGGNMDFDGYMWINTIRLFTEDAERRMMNGTFYSFIEYLNETGSSACPTAVIGIGSYKNPCKSTYSYTRAKTYIERYDGEKSEYFLTREMSFYDKARRLIDWMEATSEEDPPIGLTVGICNNPQFAEHDRDYKDHMGEVSITLRNGAGSSYLDNLYAKYDPCEVLREE